jgi:predicted transcriptional regulator
MGNKLAIKGFSWRKKHITPEMCKKMFNLKKQDGLNYTELGQRFGFSAHAISKALAPLEKKKG